jgi:hypothetical protein
MGAEAQKDKMGGLGGADKKVEKESKERYDWPECPRCHGGLMLHPPDEVNSFWYWYCRPCDLGVMREDGRVHKK